MNTKRSIPFDSSGRDELLKYPENAAIYLEECLLDGDLELFQEALQHVAKAQGGMTQLSAKTSLARESLYRSLSREGRPQMETITRVLKGLGMRISIVPEVTMQP